MTSPRRRRRASILAAASASAAALALAPAYGASASPAAPDTASGTAVRISATAARAPESAFVAASAAADGTVACVRPAPDNRVSSTVHCHTPNQVRAWYGLPPLTAASNEGAGQTIVLVDSYGSPTAVEDAQFFARTFGGPAPDVEQVFPLGRPGFTTGSGNGSTGNGSGQSGPIAAEGWAGEASLDVQWAYAIAPGAHLVLLAVPPAETQGVQGLPNLMHAMDWAVDRYPAGTVFSMSFGTSESAFAGSSAAQAFSRFDATFQRGLAKGDTFFSSSGDDGSTGVERSHRATTVSATPQTSYPNVSPFVTSVGGTQLQDFWKWDPTSDAPFVDAGGGTLARNPAYWHWTTDTGGEPVWNESWASIATGGGLSTVYPRPSFQDSVAGVVGNHRGVPDLSWNASVNGGVLVYNSYYSSADAPFWGVYGGTSASAPQVAALTAIANAARHAAGKAPVGDLNRVIYSATFNRGAAFHDVVPQTFGTVPSGHLDSNRIWDLPDPFGVVVPDPVPGYPTTAGYDLTTGWGSPRAPGYVAQLVAQP